METLIDYRETIIKQSMMNAIAKNLDLGDIQFVFPDNNKCIIIERKSISDLAQSIKDGRYKEQKLRLLSYRESLPPGEVKVIYVLEGSYSFDPGYTTTSRISSKALSSAIINTMLRDGIFIVFTKNIRDTVDFLKLLQSKVENDPDTYFRNENSIATVTDAYQYAATSGIKTKKKENIDESTCFIMQLSCIPGINTKKAIDIQKDLNVNNMAELVDSLTHDSTALTRVSGIGKQLSSNITRFVLGKSA